MLKKIHLIYLLALLIRPFAIGQGVTPSDWGLKAFHFKDAKLGDINFYVSEKEIDREKPILFLFSGTRGLPIMLVVQKGEQALQLGTIPPDIIFSFVNDYHVAFMGKPGTPFCDTMQVEEINPLQNFEDYQPSREYVEKCGLEWEVTASSQVLDTICSILPHTGEKIVAMGFSEGGHTAIQFTAENPEITHLVCGITGGLNQWYSSIINRRMDAAAGIISHREAQAEIEKLFATYKKIYSDPENTEKWYYGHPYKRWGSFCSVVPLEQLVRMEIPILFLCGSADRNNPILQCDYVMLEFLRLGKTNLTYHVLPGSDHWFSETVVENGDEKHVSHRQEAFKVIVDWLNGDVSDE